MKINHTYFLVIIVLASISCNKDVFSPYKYECIDKEGYLYKTKKYNSQVWMIENLRTNLSNDSSDIEGVYIYDDDITHLDTYGRLYTTEAAMKVCPIGWHIPDISEWQTLVKSLGEDNIGGKMKTKGTSLWESPNLGANNSSDFSAVPAGYRVVASDYNSNRYNGIGETARFRINDKSFPFIIYSHRDNISDCGYHISSAFSIRCVKDSI